MFEVPVHKTVPSPTPRERAAGLTSAFSRPLGDWVATCERHGRPRNSFETERLVAAVSILDEHRERIQKLLGDV
jgi:hypothetical protein